jgi:antitoxin FitA
MSMMIQLRNVPNDLHRLLKMRAASARMSLSDYLLSEIQEIAEKPTLAEFYERLKTREPVITPISAAEVIREERDRR